MKTKPTRSGIKKYLKDVLGFQDHELPKIIQEAADVQSWTESDKQFADYMVYDDDFRGCWNDEDQIKMNTL